MVLCRKNILIISSLPHFLVLFCLSTILFFLSDTTLEDRLKNLLTEREPRSELINSDEKSNYTSILGLRKFIHADTTK